MGTLEKFWTQFGILVLKRISKFVIPEFCDTLLVPKITKCGDLLYKVSYKTSQMFCEAIRMIPEELGFTRNHASLRSVHLKSHVCGFGCPNALYHSLVDSSTLV